MGFEDDMNLGDNYFETESADIDGDAFAEKPKKLSRKELREAKKKNAEKTAGLPKTKKGLFSRRERLDDDDSLSGEHLLDPTQSAKVSAPRERRSDYDSMGPIRNDNSEFSYLFAPADDYETEDDVYPDSSIYSDSSTARDLLGGLSYDETRDGDSSEYDKYFSENAEVRPPSKFSFKKHESKSEQNDWSNMDDDDFSNMPDTDDDYSTPVKVTPRPVSNDTAVNNENFLPELRPDSVFSPKPQETPSEPPRYFEEHKPEESEDEYMPQDTNEYNQEFMPYPAPNMYAPYPMQPMNQMMSYPVVIPNTTQAQGGLSYQAIPIPYPVPMPYPMYSQGYYPPYPQPYPPYGVPDYYGRYMPPAYPPYDDRYGAPHDRRYDGRRGHNGDPRYGDRYDDRYDRRRDSRYDRREDERSSSRRDERYDEREYSEYRDRSAYPQPPYQPPYEQTDARAAAPTPAPEPIKSEPTPVNTYSEPIYTAQPEPQMVEPISFVSPMPEPQTDYLADSAAEQPIMPNDNLRGMDFTFNRPAETSSFEQDSLSNSGFDVNEFALGMPDNSSAGSDAGDDFKFNFNDNAGYGTDMTSETPVEEGKPKGGRFKKRR